MKMIGPALLSMLLLGSAHAASPAGIIPGVDMTVQQDKKDMLLHFERGAVAGVVSDEKADGLMAYTPDFPGGQVQAFIAFDETVSDMALLPLMNYQGKLKGSVQCKRVRLGTATRFADKRVGVVAEQCAIKSLTH